MRRTIFLLLLALLVVTAVACAKSSTPSPTPAGPTEASPPPVEATSSTESPAPTAEKIGDCTVEPRTDCHQDNLQRAILHDAQLEHSNLRLANLSNADLKRANLRGANLEHANLSYANVEGAHLQRANLEDANLTGAYMWWTNLEGADLSGAILKGAKLCHTIRVNGTEDNSGCPSAPSSPTPSPSHSPSVSPSPSNLEPTITEFNVAKHAVCGIPGNDYTQAEVAWKTKAALGVKIKVDGKYWNKDAGLRGSDEVDVSCNQSRHTITLVAYNNYGTTTESGTVKVR